jgi:hypothetical protein
MEREPSESIVREMITHLKYLSMEASCYGFDKARALHSSILTDMEDGLYGWLQKEKVSDARKNFVMLSGNISQESVKNINNYFSKSNVSSNRKFEFKKAPQGELTALSCYNYNLGKCRQAADHESGNLLWRHICTKCLQEGHVERSCARQKVLN